jgi:phosphoglycerate dehydrogenase-like enzyme
MKKNTVVVLTGEQREFCEKLKTLNLPNADIFVPETQEAIRKALPEATIILADPPAILSHLDFAKNLLWMQSTFTGVDSLLQHSKSKKYILTNVRDTYGEIMAEFVLGYILFFEKDISGFILAQQEKRWAQKPFTTLHNKVVGIMGTGSIGKCIAKYCKNFGMQTYGFNKNTPRVTFFDVVYNFSQLDTFLQSVDYLISVLPKTEATTRLLNKTNLKLLRPEAIFMNIGRGNVIDEADLIEVLDKGHLKAAVLDVFNTEPLPSENPLWSHPKIFITPHVSGHYICDRIFEIFQDNYNRFIKGEDLKYVVDFKKGY